MHKSSSNTIVLIYCLQFHGFIKCFFLHFKMCFLSCLQDEIKTMECYVYTDFNFLHLSSFEPWMENKCVTCITWIQCYLKKVYEDLALGSLYWLRQSVSVFFMPNEHKDVLVPYFCRISEKTVFYETISVKLNRCYLNILRSFIVSTNQDVYACIFFF